MALALNDLRSPPAVHGGRKVIGTPVPRYGAVIPNACGVYTRDQPATSTDKYNKIYTHK